MALRGEVCFFHHFVIFRVDEEAIFQRRRAVHQREKPDQLLQRAACRPAFWPRVCALRGRRSAGVGRISARALDVSRGHGGLVRHMPLESGLDVLQEQRRVLAQRPSLVEALVVGPNSSTTAPVGRHRPALAISHNPCRVCVCCAC